MQPTDPNRQFPPNSQNGYSETEFLQAGSAPQAAPQVVSEIPAPYSQQTAQNSTPAYQPVADDFLGEQNNQQAFHRAKRHTGIVGVLKIALPLLGIFIMALVLGAYFWASSFLPEVSITAAEIEDGQMVMKNPELNGTDEKKRPFNLSAKEAIQDPTVPSKIELTEIKAKLPMDEGIFANILAGKGFYDSDAKTLKLGSSVNVTTDNGLTMALQDADIDIDSGNLTTTNPVKMLTESAEISSNMMQVLENGEIIIFEDRVKMTIYPDKVPQNSQEQTDEQSAQ